MTQTAHDISVIICAYTKERWDDLVAAVESVQKQTLPPGEMIVVIDHNPDLLERVRKHMSGVLAIENREAKGLSGARNSGATVAQRAVIAFLDDDARVLSCVLYLNEAWAVTDGGALRLHLSATESRDVLPVGGTFACFLAERYEHEVMPATRDRLSIAGWFKRRGGASSW